MRHPVEDRLQRLLAILADIAGKGPVPLADLSARYDVTPHQLRKDLTLAQFIGIPPYDLPGETPEVVFHGNAVEVWVPEHFASQPTLTRPEAFAVLAAGRAAVELNPDLDALKSAMAKLEAALHLEGGVEVEIESPEYLDQVRAAVTDRRRLQISYWSAWRDELSTRRIDPLQVVFVDGAWYLLADDDLSGQPRRFRVDRLSECVDTGERFEPTPFEPMTEVFERPLFAQSVTAWFPTASEWVTEYVDMQVTAEDDKGFTADLTSVGEVWLSRLLLRTGGRVLAPAEMVDLRQASARRALANYTPGV
jgi:proteasome accessory factor C